MDSRSPIVAGQFYPDTKEECITEIEGCIKDMPLKAELKETVIAGIVPHAGWVFSGSVASLVFSAIKKTNPNVDTFILLGATHAPTGGQICVFNGSKWYTPMGKIDIDQELANDIIENVDSAVENNIAHHAEHSIEVQVPFIQYMFPEAKIVPIMVPPSKQAVNFGAALGQIAQKIEDKTIVAIASTDLTHYGPRYGFCPHGTGSKGIEWARDVNDAEFIEKAIEMSPNALLESSLENGNACGPGAAAAVVSFALEMGKTEGKLLAHTHSADVMMAKFSQGSEESVGYAGIVF